MNDRSYQRHPLLQAGYAEWEIAELRFFMSDGQTCLDLTLNRGEAQRRLRFFGCQSVRFHPASGASFGGFPHLFDVSGDGLEGLSVLVANEDAGSSDCHLYLWAQHVVDLDLPALETR